MKQIAFALLLFTSAPLSAQLQAAKTSRVAMGHHHILVGDLEENIAFWRSLGGKSVDFGDLHVVGFPNVFIFLREEEPKDGTNGAVVNHVGLQFRELRETVKRLKAAGTPIITQEVVGAVMPVDDDGVAFNEAAGSRLAFALAPNGMRVELYENRALEGEVANHHIHFYGPDVAAMKTWYVDTFGAKPGQRAGMEAADLGGVNLTFSPADEELALTKGRALDHIGFEVDDLEAFCRELESAGIELDRPYQRVERLGIAIAFLTDPWGTYIELTEGLDGL